MVDRIRVSGPAVSVEEILELVVRTHFLSTFLLFHLFQLFKDRGEPAGGGVQLLQLLPLAEGTSFEFMYDFLVLGAVHTGKAAIRPLFPDDLT